jgi:hypothetical protein
VIIQQGNENLFLRLKQSIGQDLFEHLLAYVDFDKKELVPVLKIDDSLQKQTDLRHFD